MKRKPGVAGAKYTTMGGVAPLVPALLLLGLVIVFEHPGRSAGDFFSAVALTAGLAMAAAFAWAPLTAVLRPQGQPDTPPAGSELGVGGPAPARVSGIFWLPRRHLFRTALALLLVLLGWGRPEWALLVLLALLFVPAGWLIGGALDALAVHTARRVATARPVSAVAGAAVVVAGIVLTFLAAAAGQALAPRVPPSLGLGLWALSWGALAGTGVAAGIVAAALARRGRVAAGSRAIHALLLAAMGAGLLGYAAGAVAPGLVSPWGVPRVPLLILVVLAGTVVTSSGSAGPGSNLSRARLAPETLSDFFVSATAVVVCLVLLGEHPGGFARTPAVAAVTLAALLAGGTMAVVRGGAGAELSASGLPSAGGTRLSVWPPRQALVAGLVVLLLLYEAPRRELDQLDPVSRAGTALAWALFVLAGWRTVSAFEPLARRVQRSRRLVRLLPWLALAAALFYPIYFPVQDYLLRILRGGGQLWEGPGSALASVAFLVLGPAFFLTYFVVVASLLAVFATAGTLMASFLGDLAEAALPPPERWRRPWPSSPWVVLAPAAALVGVALAVPGEVPETRYGWGLGVAVLALAVAVLLLAAGTLRSRERRGHGDRARRVTRDLLWAALLGWFVGYTMGEAREIGAQGAVPFAALLMAGLKFFEILLEAPERITRAGLAVSALPDLLVAAVAALLLLTFIQTVAPAAAVISIKEAERIGLMVGAVLLPLARSRLRRAAAVDPNQARQAP